MHRPWENVQCVCKHGAGDHRSDDYDGGCRAHAVRSVTVQPIEPPGHPNRGLAVTRDLYDPCGCTLAREEVLFAGTQRAIAEVCEHNEKRRDGRREFTGR